MPCFINAPKIRSWLRYDCDLQYKNYLGDLGIFPLKSRAAECIPSWKTLLSRYCIHIESIAIFVFFLHNEIHGSPFLVFQSEWTTTHHPTSNIFHTLLLLCNHNNSDVPPYSPPRSLPIHILTTVQGNSGFLRLQERPLGKPAYLI